MPINTPSRKEIAQPDYGFILVQQVLIFMACAVVLALLQNLFGFVISSANLFLCILSSILFGYHRIRAAHSRSSPVSLAISAGLFGIPFLCAIAVSLFFFDTSCDGQYYHQEAIVALAGGWNPLRDVVLSTPAFPDFICYFPKGAWIVQATIYKAAGLIESGKAINLLLMAASFFSVRTALEPLERLDGRTRNAIAILLALNPVAVCQMFSFMVDGALSSLFLILSSQLLILLKNPSRLHFFTSGLAAVLLINVKYSGLVYALSLLGAWVLMIIIRHRKEMRRALLHAGAILFIGIFLFGYNPYVTNTLSTGNPFHRVIGEGATNTVDGHVHDEFLKKTRVEKFLVSIFSRSMNSLQDPPELKIPFSVSPGEMIPFFSPDTRIGGWGPLFGGAFLVAAAMMIVAALRHSPHLGIALGAGLALSVTIFVFPEPWWARYVPQAWILPFVAIVYSFYVSGNILRILRNVALTALALNVLFITTLYTAAEAWGSLYLHRHLAVLSLVSEKGPLPTTFQLYYSDRVRLQEAGVHYREVRPIGCDNPVFFDRVGRPGSDTATMVCAAREEYGRLEGELLPGLKRVRNNLIRTVLKGGKTTDGTPLAGG
ncbi:MAG TPA: hypothetical protein VMB77_12030 [Syntrophales bacterium]|nr:hypothetical protein [Syntrophales bacterium]